MKRLCLLLRDLFDLPISTTEAWREIRQQVYAVPESPRAPAPVGNTGASLSATAGVEGEGTA